MDKKELALEVIKRLKKEYPDWRTARWIMTMPGSFWWKCVWRRSVQMPG